LPLLFKRFRGAFMFRKIVACASLISTCALGSTSFTYDGHFDASEYDKQFAITYQYDGKTITGGKLALATFDNKQYVYISHPLGFKDLSYGSSQYSVGWENIEHGAKDLEKAIGSEFIKLNLTGVGGTYSVDMNPSTPDGNSKINGTSVDPSQTKTLGGSLDVSYISTIDYNAALYNGWNNLTTAQQESLTADKALMIAGKNWYDYFNGDLGGFEDNSPLTKTPAQIPGCADETSSDPSCYEVVNNADNVNVLDWDFDWGLEIELDVVNSNNLFFGNLASLDLSSFGYKTGSAVIRLDDLHASDPKHGPGHHTQGPCTDAANSPTSPDHEPCTANVVNPPEPPTKVPEPSTTLLFGLALIGLWRRRSQHG
jgi:hypothetical protein